MYDDLALVRCMAYSLSGHTFFKVWLDDDDDAISAIWISFTSVLYVIHGHRRYNCETATVPRDKEFQTKHHGICCCSLSFIQSHNIHLSSSPALFRLSWEMKAWYTTWMVLNLSILYLQLYYVLCAYKEYSQAVGCHPRCNVRWSSVLWILEYWWFKGALSSVTVQSYLGVHLLSMCVPK